MKRLLFLLFLFASFYSFGQAIQFDTTKLQLISAAGYKWYGVMAMRGLLPPADTTNNKQINSIASINGIFYIKNITAWQRVATGGAAGISQVVAGYGLLNINDSTLKVDSAVLANYFLRKGDITVVAPVTVVAAPATNPIIGLDATVKVKVATTAALSSYAGIAVNVTVTDSLQGGDFVWVSSSLTADAVLVYAATGIGSGAWVRKYTYGSPIDCRWGGVTGNGTTDDNTAMTNVENVANSLTVPIDIPSGFNIAMSPHTVTNLNYVHYISKGCTFKALSGTVGAGGTGFMTMTNITHLFFEGNFKFDGNYPTANRDWALLIIAPTTLTNTELSIGRIDFANLPLSGLSIRTVSDLTDDGYGSIFIDYVNAVNASNKRGVPLSTGFLYLRIRGGQGNVVINNLYNRGDAETWGDFNQSPASQAFGFTADVTLTSKHIHNLIINSVFSEYACGPILFFQGIDNVHLVQEIMQNTLKKPGIADSLAYTHILTKSWTFNKVDYATPNRANTRFRIDRFVMSNTTTVVNGQSNVFYSFWLDEGIQDIYIDQMDIDAYARFNGAGTTTQISGHHIINELTLRVPARNNVSMTLVNLGTVINLIKFIHTDGTYTLSGGTIKNMLQEGSERILIYADINSADTTNVSSDGVFAGTNILQATLVNAYLYTHIYYLSTVWDGTARTFGYKLNFNNIQGNVRYILQYFSDGISKTATTYSGDYEVQMKDYCEFQFSNCRFNVDAPTNDMLNRFFLTKPIMLEKKDLTVTSSWTMPLKDNQFTTTYLATYTDNDFGKYLYNNNTRSLAVTGASITTATMYDYEFLVNNSGANRTYAFPDALNAWGKRFKWVKADNSAFTITLTPKAASTDSIDGSTSNYVIPKNAETVEFVGDGYGNWQVVNKVLWGLPSSGTGTPEAAITAPIGAFYSRLDGGAGTSFYVKESGTGNTGWVAYSGNAGTVTSVGFTGGLISVATATTTPAFTVAGTSGGIPYFSSTSTWASSGLLAANAIVIGGGAGTTPSTTTTGTGVLTALGVNVGSAGAFVTFNGALGTPSSGTVTNLTGTASININGTVGATTPAAGTFTTGTINTSLTMADATNIILNTTTGTKYGTATTQKLAFYNSTPIVQPTGSVITALQNLGLVASATVQGAELTITDVTTNNFTTSAHGFVPKGTNVGNFLKDDGTWASVSGSGTVTTVSVVTANGVSGSIANATTTPAITLTLGAITPTTVNGNTFTTGSSTYTGTAAQTYTFPTTSATIARTDAANTFTGTQTFSGLIVVNGNLGTITTTNAYIAASNVISASDGTAKNQIGGSSNINARVVVGGTSSSTVTIGNSYGNFIVSSSPVTTPASGTNGLLAQLAVPAFGTITQGAASLTNTALLWLGTASSATVTGGNYAIWSTSGINRLDGSLELAYVAKTGTYTITNTDHTIDCTSGTFTVTLPTAVGIQGMTYVIINSGAGTITLATTSSQTISGAASKTLNVQYSGFVLQSDNANWKIIGTF